MSFSYILSVKRLLLSLGALHAKDSGPSCPIMMHHHQTNIRKFYSVFSTVYLMCLSCCLLLV